MMTLIRVTPLTIVSEGASLPVHFHDVVSGLHIASEGMVRLEGAYYRVGSHV